MLDTTVLVAAEREKFDLLALYAAYADEEFHISAITVSELLHGVARADTPARRQARSKRVEAYLQHLDTIEFDVPIARKHATLWAQLERAGQMIGAHDLIIAATALQFGHSLVTLNRNEFGRVSGLRLIKTESYLRPARPPVSK